MSTPNEPPEVKRVYRSRTERMISGVCGGIAEYFNIDPTLVRLAFVLLIFANGIGLILYVIAAIIIPLNPTAVPSRGPPVKIPIAGSAASVIVLVIGVLILLLGVASLISLYAGAAWSPWSILGFVGQVFWPLSLIAVGIIVLFVALGSGRRRV